MIIHPANIRRVFPSIPSGAAGVGYSEEGAPTNTHDVIVPTTINSGDLLILIVTLGGDRQIDTITGWTILDETSNGASQSLSIAYKIASGSETDFTYTSAGGGTLTTNRCFRIINWHGTTPPEAGTGSTGDSANPNPPSLSPSWGNAKTLFFAVTALDTGTVSGYPTNYDDNQFTDTTIGVGIGVATRELKASSDNPGTFTFTSDTWVAQTLAVRPG